MTAHQVKNIQEMVGKTIKLIEHDCDMITIQATDGAFLIVQKETGYYDETSLVVQHEFILKDNQHLAVRLGVATLEEIAEQNRQEQQRFNEAMAAQERKTYEQLKRKFESS